MWQAGNIILKWWHNCDTEILLLSFEVMLISSNLLVLFGVVRHHCVPAVYMVIMCLVWADISSENNRFFIIPIFQDYNFLFSLFGHYLALIFLKISSAVGLSPSGVILSSGLSVGQWTHPSSYSLNNTCFWAAGLRKKEKDGFRKHFCATEQDNFIDIMNNFYQS